MPLPLPAIDIRNEVQHQYTSRGNYRTVLFENQTQLLIGKRNVVVIEGGTFVSRKLCYETDVVTATFTKFETEIEKSLVVCLKGFAQVYCSDGRQYIINFPFKLKRAFPFDFGLILEKEPMTSNSVEHPGQFMTLVDPLGEFRLVSTSSTSVIAFSEFLVAFPQEGLNKGNSATICATFNSNDNSVVLYHVRSLGRMSRKKTSDDFFSSTSTGHLIVPSIQPSLSMDKKRTSTLLSDVSSIARMSEPGFAEPSAFKKDLIWSHLDSFPKQSPKSVHILNFEDQSSLCISTLKSTTVYIYQQPSFRFQQNFSTPYPSVPLNNKQHPGWLVALASPFSLKLIHPFLEIESGPIEFASNYPPIIELQSAFGNDVVLLGNNNKTYILKLALDPTNDLITHGLKALSYLSGSKIRETLWVLWCTALAMEDQKNEWNAFVIVLLGILYWEAPSGNTSITKFVEKAKSLHQAASLSYSFVDLAPYIVLALHLLREELMLDDLANDQVEKMGELLAQLTIWMGWPSSWANYYMIPSENLDHTVQFLSVSILDSPPNLLESLSSLFGPKIIRYVTFSELVEEDESVDKIITPRTYCVLRLFELLVSPHYGPADLVDMMCEYGITSSDLDSFPLGISIPLREALLECQETPTFEWNSQALELVGRKDLNAFFKDPINVTHINTNGVSSISHIVGGLFDKKESSIAAWDGQIEADRISTTKLIFDNDRRFFEITTLLHQTKTQVATLKADASEYDLVVLQRELAALVALRTLTVPLGRAALFFASRMPLMTEKFPIPKFNFDCKILPSGTAIVLSKDSLPDVAAQWGYFHNGVSSGLSISPESKGISGSWIIYNKPPELNAQHAGFLLGLGLNGHLKKLEEWHIYNYLGPKHPLTSVGLLLGMSASLKGTMDNKLTKVLSVHAVALLPQGANDLNVPIVVQTAGLIGIGLLYLASQHRRMSEIMLSQISSIIGNNDVESINEGYRLAAGIALGLVNLAKGNDLKGLGDTRVLDRLLTLATSMKDYQSYEEIDKSACGAVMALALIYMKTGKENVASKLKAPDSDRLLDYIRPDILFIRCLAKNLILWDKIEESIEWVHREVPQCLKHYLVEIETLDSDQLSFFNILGGTCMSIALRYASSNSITARNTILHFLDIMMKISELPSKNYDQKVAHNGACRIRNILALCLSVIVAGSGDLETFRRLRVLHGDLRPDVEYGSHMVVNMGLGFLFLGAGQYAFGESNFATACLALSMYPIFPGSHSEHEVHLQAMRHFWALAVEPRCLVVRDVNTKLAIKVPVEIILQNNEILETISPCLLPPLSHISRINVKSVDHFDVSIDFEVQSLHLEKFKKNLTIYVVKRQNQSVLEPSVGLLLENANKALQLRNGNLDVDQDLLKISKLSILDKSLDEYEKNLLISNDYLNINEKESSFLNLLDGKIQLSQLALEPKTIRDLWSLKILFAISETRKMKYIPSTYIDRLKNKVYSNLAS